MSEKRRRFAAIWMPLAYWEKVVIQKRKLMKQFFARHFRPKLILNADEIYLFYGERASEEERG